jgi:hypothetical protein
MLELSGNALEKNKTLTIVVALLKVGLDNTFVVCCFLLFAVYKH